MDHTRRAFEFEGAVWNSLGKWNSFIWKANNDDVTRGFLINIHEVGTPPNKYCFLIGTYEYKMNANETDIGDVIILWDRHWWCQHVMLSSPEVFTPIFLQFLPKTRLAKDDHSLNYPIGSFSDHWLHLLYKQVQASALTVTGWNHHYRSESPYLLRLFLWKVATCCSVTHEGWYTHHHRSLDLTKVCACQSFTGFRLYMVFAV